jgi:hypothetical protein
MPKLFENLIALLGRPLGRTIRRERPAIRIDSDRNPESSETDTAIATPTAII